MVHVIITGKAVENDGQKATSKEGPAGISQSLGQVRCVGYGGGGIFVDQYTYIYICVYIYVYMYTHTYMHMEILRTPHS